MNMVLCERVAKLMNFKNEVDKELNTRRPHIFIAINTNIGRDWSNSGWRNEGSAVIGENHC